MRQKSTERDKGQSFLRAYKILEAIVRSPTPLSASELNMATGVPRPSVVRLCHSLQQEGLITRAIDGKSYTFGNRLCSLGAEIIAGGMLQAERSVLLRRAAEQIGQTCNIVVHDRGSMIIADRVESNWAVRAVFEVGMRVPLHCSASGKLFLSFLPKFKRTSILRNLALGGELTGEASSKPIDIAALERELEEIRAERVSIDDQQLRGGMVAIAVPITDKKGRFCAALSSQSVAHVFSVVTAREHVGTLHETARLMQKLIGQC